MLALRNWQSWFFVTKPAPCDTSVLQSAPTHPITRSKSAQSAIRLPPCPSSELKFKGQPAAALKTKWLESEVVVAPVAKQATRSLIFARSWSCRRQRQSEHQKQSGQPTSQPDSLVALYMAFSGLVSEFERRSQGGQAWPGVEVCIQGDPRCCW